jgi:hypothetical protein
MLRYIYLLAGLMVFVWIIYNQIRIRQVRRNLHLTVPIILVVLGLPNILTYVNTGKNTGLFLAGILAGLLFIAVVMGALRAFTVRIWAKDNMIFQQGTWITIVLWVVTIALHLLIDQIGNVGESSLLITYGITLSIQRWVIYSRARREFPISQINGMI